MVDGLNSDVDADQQRRRSSELVFQKSDPTSQIQDPGPGGLPKVCVEKLQKLNSFGGEKEAPAAGGQPDGSGNRVGVVAHIAIEIHQRASLKCETLRAGNPRLSASRQMIPTF